MQDSADWNAGEGWSFVKYAKSYCGHCKSWMGEDAVTHQYRHCLPLEDCYRTGSSVINWMKHIPEIDFRGKLMALVSRKGRRVVCF